MALLRNGELDTTLFLVTYTLLDVSFVSRAIANPLEGMTSLSCAACYHQSVATFMCFAWGFCLCTNYDFNACIEMHGCRTTGTKDTTEDRKLAETPKNVLVYKLGTTARLLEHTPLTSISIF